MSHYRKESRSMGWFGKLAFGSLGMLFGGPLGAVIGAAVGHQLIDKRNDTSGYGFQSAQTGRLNDVETHQAAYFVCIFSVLGKLAKADGVVTHDELAVVDNVINSLQVPEQEKAFARGIFNESKSSPYSIEDFALQFYQMNKSRQTVLCSFIDILFQVAAADGALHPAEEKALNAIKSIFGLHDQQFDSIKARYFKDVDKYYRILNCTSSSTSEEIKKNYKKLAKDFHPDTIISKGLPDEFVDFATRRFQEIQEAYEKVRQDRGL